MKRTLLGGKEKSSYFDHLSLNKASESDEWWAGTVCALARLPWVYLLPNHLCHLECSCEGSKTRMAQYSLSLPSRKSSSDPSLRPAVELPSARKLHHLLFPIPYQLDLLLVPPEPGNDSLECPIIFPWPDMLPSAVLSSEGDWECPLLVGWFK